MNLSKLRELAVALLQELDTLEQEPKQVELITTLAEAKAFIARTFPPKYVAVPDEVYTQVSKHDPNSEDHFNATKL